MFSVIIGSTKRNDASVTSTPRRLYHKESEFQMDTSNSTVLIPLTKGYSAIVDIVDADLADLKWHVSTRNNYATRSTGGRSKRRNEWLHRIILERKLNRKLTVIEYPDHINGNGLDNRRQNLRVASMSQNNRNTPLSKSNTSGYKGVIRSKSKRSPWQANITYKNKRIYIGNFASAESAYEAYKQKAKELFGDFARVD